MTQNVYTVVICDRCKQHTYEDGIPSEIYGAKQAAHITVQVGTGVKHIDLCMPCLEIFDAVLSSMAKLDQQF